MTIERSWWPAGDSQMDKFQASVLISLAIEIDKIEMPKNLGLQPGRNDLPDGTQVRNWYLIGKDVNSATYRKYCEKLWERSSPAVKFLYLVSGLEPGILYVSDIAASIGKLKHRTKEVREDWHKCYALLVMLVENVAEIRRKATIEAVLNETGGTDGLEKMFTSDNRIKLLMRRFRQFMVEASPEHEQIQDLINKKVSQASGLQLPRHPKTIDGPLKFRPGDPCPDPDCDGEIIMVAICSEDCGWHIDDPSPAYLRSIINEDDMTVAEPCPDCPDGHIHLAVECTECETDFIEHLQPEDFPPEDYDGEEGPTAQAGRKREKGEAAGDAD